MRAQFNFSFYHKPLDFVGDLCYIFSDVFTILRWIFASDLLALALTDNKEQRYYNMVIYSIFQTTAWIWNTYSKIIKFQEHRYFFRSCVRQKVMPFGLQYNLELGFKYGENRKANLLDIKAMLEKERYVLDFKYYKTTSTQNIEL